MNQTRAVPDDGGGSARKRARPSDGVDASGSSSSSTPAGESWIHTMRFGPDPIKVMSFARMRSLLPEALDALLLDIEKAKSGAVPIISHSRRDEIRRSDQAAEDISDRQFLPVGREDQVESPPVEDVIRIMEMAGECSSLRYDEHAWNCGVNWPLLRLAIPANGLLKIVPCTAARVSDMKLLPVGMPNGKMADFCLAIDPYWPLGRQFSTPASEAVENVSRLQPSHSISHTTYKPLAEHPIALSIVTGHGGDKAEARLGLWQTAQWRMLKSLVHQSNAGDVAGPACLEELGFLPGIYIVGHDWRFAATTWDPESGRSTLLRYEDLGSTADASGIYRIFWGLRRIQKYLTDVYWPWYQTYVLDMEEELDG
ncbi:hypothetical protein MAPG_10694 [Magnaporthiopsis poae ATCC 64411]|uniref:PD-(D/E)XK nuclease-like domain-containing protein n=1 Tax=Magnaporthiopsis poae (strain ATCC 64411 / 73-15) TaxID=644358 RepID=A0A0C4EDA0_MAGP6|nr:hypothetical protein MAPG_10694 [Magnaporthiopsis poae ATCC 64411]